jgi:hypothetical protein
MVDMAADIRDCDQCGALFAPRREHARFCSADCRIAWNDEKKGDPAVGASALQWSITAMNETAQRLPAAGAWDQPRAFAVIGETVWQVTIVDATLVRYYPDIYDTVLADQPAAERRRIEGAMAGLRFVRNRMRHETDHADFICPLAGQPGQAVLPGRAARSAAAGGPITSWTWKSVPEPPLAALLPRGRVWELARHRAYQAHLAGRAVGEAFERTTAFLRLTAAHAAAEISAAAPR